MFAIPDSFLDSEKPVPLIVMDWSSNWPVARSVPGHHRRQSFVRRRAEEHSKKRLAGEEDGDRREDHLRTDAVLWRLLVVDEQRPANQRRVDKTDGQGEDGADSWSWLSQLEV